jgi:hypothetical protein
MICLFSQDTMVLIAYRADSMPANCQNHLKSACPALMGDILKTDERDAIPEVVKGLKTFGMTQLSLTVSSNSPETKLLNNSKVKNA